MDALVLEFYKYRTLKPDVEDIRLLEIETSRSVNDTVSCRLRHHRLKDIENVLIEERVEKKNYETLSYAVSDGALVAQYHNLVVNLLTLVLVGSNLFRWLAPHGYDTMQ